MGFSLDDISKLLYENSHETNYQMLLEREKQLKKEILWQQTILDSIEEARNEYGEMINNDGKFTLGTSPSIAILQTQKDSEYDPNNISPKLINWLEKLPLVSICPEFSIDDLKTPDNKCNFSYSIPLEYADKFSFTNSKDVKILPEMQCVITTIHT
ncbi:hypothetical protein H9X77_12770, partial [Clostridium saudiense]|nr:hypothetical protein [Clostridium saudiense]